MHQEVVKNRCNNVGKEENNENTGILTLSWRGRVRRLQTGGYRVVLKKVMLQLIKVPQVYISWCGWS